MLSGRQRLLRSGSDRAALGRLACERVLDTRESLARLGRRVGRRLLRLRLEALNLGLQLVHERLERLERLGRLVGRHVRVRVFLASLAWERVTSDARVEADLAANRAILSDGGALLRGHSPQHPHAGNQDACDALKYVMQRFKSSGSLRPSNRSPPASPVILISRRPQLFPAPSLPP